MTPKELRARTHAFAVAMNAFCQPLLLRTATREAAEQLLGASSSVGSNHRAAGKARSHAEFAAKIGTVDEEADESLYWLQYLRDCRLVPEAELAPHLDEASQLAAIFGASAKTARLNEERRRSAKRRARRGRPARLASEAGRAKCDEENC
jgi:four helix bundle protein